MTALVQPDVWFPSQSRLGAIYGGYRLTLAVFLLLLHVLTRSQPLVGAESPALYLGAVVGYALAGVMQFGLYWRWRRWLPEQLLLMLGVDVLALSVMLYANGGPSLQMSMLYLVVVVAANILLGSGRGLFIAVLSVLTVIWQQFYFALTDQADVRTVGAALLLSASFIGVYLLTRDLVGRLREMEKVAAQQAGQMQQLQAINQRVIEQLAAGVVVVDEHGQVMLSNQAACQLLHAPLDRHTNLAQASPALTKLLATPQQDYFTLPAGPLQTLGVHVLPLHLTPQLGLRLLLIENLDRITQQAQQLKLASLGRLTASIAHEIRNPLAAIRQAAELMHEHTDPSHPDAQLTSMVMQHSDRINRIITSILQLSRRQAAPEWIRLEGFLKHLLAEDFAGRPVHLTVPAGVQVFFDRDQLGQVLANLIGNALHHSSKLNPGAAVLVLVHADGAQQPVRLDVIDHGAGLSAAAQANLFEPFMTTEPTGTGLGLYLSRAYCEANGARLTHVPTPCGACFRIHFALHATARPRFNVK